MKHQDQKLSPSNPTERLIQHLRRHPYDLIDVRTLMIRFQASAEDFQQALIHLEQQVALKQ